MGRFIINPLENSNKPHSSALMARGRAERTLLQSLRLWALTRRGEGRSHAMGEWRQVFLAALEPHSRVSICEGALEDALADLDGFLATVVGSPERIWRFHHPRCIGIDADEVALLDILRLVRLGEMEAGAHTLRGLIGPDRTERAMRYLDGVVKSLGQCGLGLPLARSTGSGLDLTH